jgi:hypothetical protein
MLIRAAAFLAKGIIPVIVVLYGCLAEAQMNPAGGIRMPGSITSTGFAGALAGSVQGTFPGGRSPQGLYLGGLGGFFPFATPYPNWAPAPPAIFNVSYEAPPALIPVADAPPPPGVVFAPAAEPPTVSVFVVATERSDAPPQISPELRRQNSQNLQALSKVLHVSASGEPAAAESAASVPSSSPSRETEPLLLIAFKDRNVVTAIAYWTDRGTLHFVTPAREQKQAPLSDVDWDRSRALNSERGVPFSVTP